MRAPDSDLAALLAEVRPVPGEAAAQRLDARVARALAAPALAVRLRRRRHAIRLPALALAACAVLALVLGLSLHPGGPGGGTSGSSGGSSASEGSGSSPAASSGASSAAGSGSSSAGAGASAGDSLSAAPSGSGRAVERSTTMRIGTAPGNVDAVAAGAARVAAALGGYVASSDVTAGQGASLDLRVPGDRLDTAIQRLSQLGHVRALARSSLDITDQRTAARQRVADARALRRSLLGRLAAATTARRADRLRALLATATRRLAHARRAVAAIRTRTADATVGLTVAAERRHGAAVPGGGGPWTPGDALHDAGRVLEVAAGVIVVALAAILPPAGLLLPAWLGIRRLRRLRREHVLDAPA